METQDYLEIWEILAEMEVLELLEGQEDQGERDPQETREDRAQMVWMGRLEEMQTLFQEPKEILEMQVEMEGQEDQVIPGA